MEIQGFYDIEGDDQINEFVTLIIKLLTSLFEGNESPDNLV